jgi:uncharacterized protein YpuA (DUF1002 family)
MLFMEQKNFTTKDSHPRTALWLGLIVLVLALAYVFLFYKNGIYNPLSNSTTTTTGPSLEEQQQVYSLVGETAIPTGAPANKDQKKVFDAVVNTKTTTSGPSTEEQQKVLNIINTGR